MSKIYFLVRWWPHFNASFPFDRFDDVPDERMNDELEKFAVELSKAHAAKLYEARKAAADKSNARRMGTPEMSVPTPRRSAKSLKESPADWDEIVRFMGWYQSQRLSIVNHAQMDTGTRPTTWRVFYASDDESTSETIADIVRDQVQAPYGFFRWRNARKDAAPAKRWVAWEQSLDAIVARSLKPDAPVAGMRPFMDYFEHASQEAAPHWVVGIHRTAKCAAEVLVAGLAANQVQPKPEQSAANTQKDVEVAAKKKPRKIGRPHARDPKRDAQVAAARDTGAYRSNTDLGNAMNMSAEEVGKALDRHRKRKKSN